MKAIITSRTLITIVLAAIFVASFGCGSSREPASPVETFQTYIRALKKKDYTSAKLLLSNATIKMHEQQAKAQGTTVDDIIARESLVGANPTTVRYRNEKIDGDKATLEVENSADRWEQLPFVREDGVWKIDKAGYAQQIINDVDDQDKVFDELNNANHATPQP